LGAYDWILEVPIFWKLSVTPSTFIIMEAPAANPPAKERPFAELSSAPLTKNISGLELVPVNTRVPKKLVTFPVEVIPDKEVERDARKVAH